MNLIIVCLAVVLCLVICTRIVEKKNLFLTISIIIAAVLAVTAFVKQCYDDVLEVQNSNPFTTIIDDISNGSPEYEIVPMEFKNYE